MKKTIKAISLIMALMMTIGVMAITPFTASAETPTENTWVEPTSGTKEVHISTAQDFYDFNEFACLQQNDYHKMVGITVYIENDIDLNPGWDAAKQVAGETQNVTPVKTGTIAYFAGTIDGQGHTISGMYIAGSGTASDGRAQSFIWKMAGSAKNISFKNACITGASNTMGLFAWGYKEGATFENVYSDVILNCTSSSPMYAAGGIVACQRKNNVSYTNCVFAGEISGYRSYVGGIVGTTEAFSATLTECVNLGRVEMDTSGGGNERGGGLVGNVAGSVTFNRCLVLGEVVASPEDSDWQNQLGALAYAYSYCFVDAGSGSAGHIANTNYAEAISLTFNDCYYLSSSFNSSVGLAVKLARGAKTVTYNGVSANDIASVESVRDVLELDAFKSWYLCGDDVIVPEYIAKNALGFSDVEVIGVQNTEPANGLTDLRFVVGIHNLGYEKLGYEISMSYGENTVTVPEAQSTTEVVYSSITADNESVKAEDKASAYMCVAVIEDIVTDGATVTVRAYAVKNGTKIYTDTYELTTTDGSVSLVKQ